MPAVRNRTMQKRRILKRWVHRRLGSVAHEERVLDIATALFDLTGEQHELGIRFRRLLELGAIVHDVGRSIDDAKHPSKGARLILRQRSLPLTAAERRALAYLTLYHRGAVPPANEKQVLRPEDDRRSLRMLLALLRSADALDSRRVQSPRLVLAMCPASLTVTCYVDDDGREAMKIYRSGKKFRLLERLMDRPVRVKVVRAESVCVLAKAA